MNSSPASDGLVRFYIPVAKGTPASGKTHVSPPGGGLLSGGFGSCDGYGGGEVCGFACNAASGEGKKGATLRLGDPPRNPETQKMKTGVACADMQEMPSPANASLNAYSHGLKWASCGCGA
jgi:hypothetical protein